MKWMNLLANKQNKQKKVVEIDYKNIWKGEAPSKIENIQVKWQVDKLLCKIQILLMRLAWVDSVGEPAW
jgi:hypothetical protein